MALKLAKPQSLTRHWLLLIILGLTLYVILPQLKAFDASFDKINNADTIYIVLALIPFSVTYLAAAANYYFLALKPLRYARTLLVQLAGMFVNRLLPAGLGALGINFLYLRQNKHSSTQAGVVVGLNNTIGFVGHSLLVLLALPLAAQLPPLEFKLSSLLIIGLVSLIVCLAVITAFNPKARRWLKKTAKNVYQQLATYSHRPQSLLAALGSSAVLTLCHVATLWFCLQAVGADLPWLAILIVLGLGVAVGSAVPTPGGLGGVEAGLVAGFVAFQIPADIALAAVLIYRLITYWLALVIGVVALVICRRRGLINWRQAT